MLDYVAYLLAQDSTNQLLGNARVYAPTEENSQSARPRRWLTVLKHLNVTARRSASSEPASVDSGAVVSAH